MPSLLQFGPDTELVFILKGSGQKDGSEPITQTAVF